MLALLPSAPFFARKRIIFELTKARDWFHNSKWGETPMRNSLLKLTTRLRILLNEEGQDLIEYALVVALIAFSATAGMSSLAAAINNAFTGVGNTLGSYIA
jgi:pilus assembly protein Flp/PilA